MNDLTPDRLAALKALLEARKSALLGQFAGRPANEFSRTPAVEEIETSPADSASNRTLNQLEAEADDHRLAQLAAIRHALAKFASGDYGICESCGGPIGASRLDARPEACLCIGCQTRMERSRH
ncbi:TraR/DksA family transcriptional regulator [Pseudoduganella chitinolytica]|uniref:TraR/DksA family transcriptional regulator n=1 Tax=Pseudoduganella chitinolytica TaxID=34070 RepID=A0ABY8BKH4_9BURK|nr:TraR/DksA family transcriptional regulator [Pseudoduganella chitinolytica]WEF35406.1 TraR/DksA family transcriptional regulator [Pseudoduganella chitinolytica]